MAQLYKIFLATFFNYGSTNGDLTLARGDDTCTQVNFNFNFNYYGNVFTSCCIKINGYIPFDYNSITYQYLIAPFRHDLSTIYTGNIYYRLISDAQSLNQIGVEISSLYYLNTVNFIPTNAFIVTWDSVPYYTYYGSANPSVSFQIILSTDGSNSFLTVNYGSLGFSASDGHYFQYGAYKTTISLNNPMFSSNVGINGKWIYHLSIS